MPIRETKYSRRMENALKEFERRETSLVGLAHAFAEYNHRVPEAPDFSEDDERETCIVDFLIALVDLCHRDEKITTSPETLLRYALVEYERGNGQ